MEDNKFFLVVIIALLLMVCLFASMPLIERFLDILAKYLGVG